MPPTWGQELTTAITATLTATLTVTITKAHSFVFCAGRAQTCSCFGSPTMATRLSVGVCNKGRYPASREARKRGV